MTGVGRTHYASVSLETEKQSMEQDFQTVNQDLKEEGDENRAARRRRMEIINLKQVANHDSSLFDNSNCSPLDRGACGFDTDGFTGYQKDVSHRTSLEEEEEQSQSRSVSIASSPSQQMEEAETMSIDSSFVSYNSEEEIGSSDFQSSSRKVPQPLDLDSATILAKLNAKPHVRADADAEIQQPAQRGEADMPTSQEDGCVAMDCSSVDHTPQESENENSNNSNNRIRRSIPWGYVSITGRRSEMEDAVAAVPAFYSLSGGYSSATTKPPALHFFGVYDGHGGDQASNYCRERLHHALVEELQSRMSGEEDIKIGSEWEKAFMNCFKKVDVEVGLEPIGSECCGEPVAPETVGTTAVVAVVGPSHLIVGNCGDSRAVLCRAGKAIPLSVDHKPQREDETARIEAAGGKVFCWNGYRVLGVLAMSRAIGDRYLKPSIIPDPEVTFTERVKEDECLILASDGLWDVVSNEEACQVARKRIARWHLSEQTASPSVCKVAEDQSMDPASLAAATHLCKLALQRGSSDNITVLVVDLKAKRKKAVRNS